MSASTRNNPITGGVYFFKGLSLITQKGVKRYVVIPLIINILLFVTAIYIAALQLPLLMAWVVSMLPTWLIWLSWLLIPLFIIISILMLLLSFTLIGNLIATPFNSRLAEVIEQKMTGQAPVTPGGVHGFISSIISGLYSELQKLIYIGLRAIPLLVLLLIPGLNLVALALWLVFSSWVLAMEYADYPMANHGLGFSRQRRLMQKRRFLFLGYGGILTLALLVPGLNLLLIPAGVAGATAMWVEQLSANAGEDVSTSVD